MTNDAVSGSTAEPRYSRWDGCSRQTEVCDACLSQAPHLSLRVCHLQCSRYAHLHPVATKLAVPHTVSAPHRSESHGVNGYSIVFRWPHSSHPICMGFSSSLHCQSMHPYDSTEVGTSEFIVYARFVTAVRLPRGTANHPWASQCSTALGTDWPSALSHRLSTTLLNDVSIIPVRYAPCLTVPRHTSLCAPELCSLQPAEANHTPQSSNPQSMLPSIVHWPCRSHAMQCCLNCCSLQG